MEIKDLIAIERYSIPFPKEEEPGILIWRTNSSIRKSLLRGEESNQEQVYVTMDFDAFNKIKEEYPKTYIEILKVFQHAMMNQIYYKIEGDKVEIACSQVLNETPMWYLFSTTYREGIDGMKHLYIDDLSSSETLKKGKWLSVKAMNRNIDRRLTKEDNNIEEGK